MTEKRKEWPKRQVGDYVGELMSAPWRLEAVRYGFPPTPMPRFYSSEATMPLPADIIRHLDRFTEIRAEVLDHYKVVEFWDELDLVGMTSYYKLSAEPNPSLESLIEAWKPIKRGLLRWQARIGKPLLFTEVGWCSQEGASIEPWNYYYKQEATKVALEEQRRCYRAFMETWCDTPEVGGVIWWEWVDSPSGPEDFNYTPKGKPAEGELRTWFKTARKQRRVTASSGRDTSPGREGEGKAAGG